MRKDIKKLAQQIEAELEEVERICKLNGYEKPVVISVDLNISRVVFIDT
jgi:hypothetical protein